MFPQTNKIVILDLATGLLVKNIEKPNLNLEQVFLDETGCFLSTLNDTRNQINIYMFEWQYEVKEPPKVVKTDKTQEEIEKIREIAEEAERQQALLT